MNDLEKRTISAVQFTNLKNANSTPTSIEAESNENAGIGIGDILSDKKGSGARYNEGKAPLELIPLRLIAKLETRQGSALTKFPEIRCLQNLSIFQEKLNPNNPKKDREVLENAISDILMDSPKEGWKECAKVFDFGRKKYADWNWAKGMPWSAVIGSAARHLVFGLMNENPIDEESGLTHRGHLLCNLVMLWTYVSTYPEGDDRTDRLTELES